MSGTMSKYIVEDEDIQCFYPDAGHCPIHCISRSYAHLFMRFQDLEQSIREMKHTLNAVMDYIRSSNSSDSDRAHDKKKAKKMNTSRGSRSENEGIRSNIDQQPAQATLETDFTQLLTWKDSDDEVVKPKKPKRCQIISCLKSRSSSSNGDTTEDSSEEDGRQSGLTEAGDIMDKVGKIIDDMAKVVDDIQETAAIQMQVTADCDEMAGKINDDQSKNEEGSSDSEFAGDFVALYNEMNEVD